MITTSLSILITTTLVFLLYRNLQRTNNRKTQKLLKNSEVDYSTEVFTSPSNFTVLIYNRVPKCASTTMKTVLRSLQTKNNYKVVDIVAQHERHYLRLNKSQYLDSDDLKWNNDTKKFLNHTFKRNTDDKLLFIRHTFYIPDIKLKIFGHEKVNVYKYINVVKHPVDQYISWYYS